MIQCKVCEAGQLVKKRVFRMSGVVVTIGFILLIPSILGILFGLLLMIGAVGAGGSMMAVTREEVDNRMASSGVPTVIRTKVKNSESLTQEEMQTLTQAQRTLVTEAESEIMASRMGAGIGGTFMFGFAVIMIVLSFVGGLLGWLLVMRKNVLQCNQCGAVTAAS